jgi:aspartyl/asparaginyl beta-hydroxylase (cupin superfamily)
MADKKEALWFRTEGPYKGDAPAFYDPETIDWAKRIMDNWHVIREELSPMIDEGKNELLKPYFEDAIQFPPKNWKTESFYFWTRANRIMINLFPKTHAIIKEVPGLVSASINLLEPGSRIMPHYGDTNAIYRCHLGLQVPAGLPECGFRVNNESRPWEEGKFIIFLDAYTHEAFNNSTGKRYILLLDVLRPEFRSKKYRVCTRVLGTTTLYEIAVKIPGLRERVEKTPLIVLAFFLIFAQAYTWLYLFLQRNIFNTHLK